MKMEKQEIENKAGRKIGGYPVSAWYDNKRQRWFVKPKNVSKVKKLGRNMPDSLAMIGDGHLSEIKDYLLEKGYIDKKKKKRLKYTDRGMDLYDIIPLRFSNSSPSSDYIYWTDMRSNNENSERVGEWTPFNEGEVNFRNDECGLTCTNSESNPCRETPARPERIIYSQPLFLTTDDRNENELSFALTEEEKEFLVNNYESRCLFITRHILRYNNFNGSVDYNSDGNLELTMIDPESDEDVKYLISKISFTEDELHIKYTIIRESEGRQEQTSTRISDEDVIERARRYHNEEEIVDGVIIYYEPRYSSLRHESIITFNMTTIQRNRLIEGLPDINISVINDIISHNNLNGFVDYGYNNYLFLELYEPERSMNVRIILGEIEISQNGLRLKYYNH